MADANSHIRTDKWVSIDPRIEKPVLYSVDEINIEKETGVRARIRPQFGMYGELMLKLTFKGGCAEKALQAAEIKAMAIIKFNWDNPRHYVEDAVQPPPYTSDEYVEDPVEEMIRFAQHGRSRFMTQLASNVEPPRPPKRPLSPPNGDGGSNKKGFFGPRHGQAEGEQYPARHGQPCPDIRPDIIEDREAAPCPSRRCKVCRNCCVGVPSPYYDANAVCCAFWDELD